MVWLKRASIWNRHCNRCDHDTIVESPSFPGPEQKQETNPASCHLCILILWQRDRLENKSSILGCFPPWKHIHVFLSTLQSVCHRYRASSVMEPFTVSTTSEINHERRIALEKQKPCLPGRAPLRTAEPVLFWLTLLSFPCRNLIRRQCSGKAWDLVGLLPAQWCGTIDKDIQRHCFALNYPPPTEDTGSPSRAEVLFKKRTLEQAISANMCVKVTTETWEGV